MSNDFEYQDSETLSPVEEVVEETVAPEPEPEVKPSKKKSAKKPSTETKKTDTSGKKIVLNASDLNLFIEISRSESYFIGSRQKVEVAEEHLDHPKFKAYAKQLRVL